MLKGKDPKLGTQSRQHLGFLEFSSLGFQLLESFLGYRDRAVDTLKQVTVLFIYWGRTPARNTDGFSSGIFEVKTCPYAFICTIATYRYSET